MQNHQNDGNMQQNDHSQKKEQSPLCLKKGANSHGQPSLFNDHFGVQKEWIPVRN